jgi:hypothetical protein
MDASPGRAVELIDRTDERGALDRLVDAVRAGMSGVLVLRGEPGVGKTVLLDYMSRQAAGCQIARVAGMQSEMELPFAALPEDTRRLLQVAAAEPTGDASVVWRAAEELGIGTGAAVLAVQAGLVEFGVRVRFRHPLARSAAYWSASVPQRLQVHAALAAAIDPAADPDCRAWHRAGRSASDLERAGALQ